jgi:Spy/CpxP family protein refolding chaperone
MSWIRFAVAGIALCAGASVASAQGGPPAGAPPMGQQGGQNRGGRGMQALLENITLTADQQTKVDAIGTKYRAEMQGLMPNGMQGGPPDEATRKKMDEIREHQTHDIRELLTDDQRKIFDENVATQKKRREEMMKQRQAQGR